ncbi:MAG: phosphoglycerate dehydrogenase [Candidatus Omnitrophica bacterium]|nr:phosphoglycerate dehydrogenase [Candidatus Omnitrophota bacterium]
MAQKRKILVTTGTFCQFDKIPLELLKKEGYEVLVNPMGRTLASEEESLRFYTSGICGVIAGTEPITRRVIEQAKQLEVISRIGVGLDSVDFEAVRERGIQVFKSDAGVADAVAELTVGLILAALRRVPEADRVIRRGEWGELMGGMLRGKTVGIIGMGHIGKKVVELCQVFGVKCLVYDTIKNPSFAQRFQVSYADLEVLLRESDVISVHVPRTDQTRNLLNGERLRQIKQGAVLVNTSRGGIVDEQGLHELLRSKHLAAAALDVYDHEPYQGPLAQLENVILTCHMGTCAREARVQMERQAAENLISGLSQRALHAR